MGQPYVRPRSRSRARSLAMWPVHVGLDNEALESERQQRREDDRQPPPRSGGPAIKADEPAGAPPRPS